MPHKGVGFCFVEARNLLEIDSRSLCIWKVFTRQGFEFVIAFLAFAGDGPDVKGARANE